MTAWTVPTQLRRRLRQQLERLERLLLQVAGSAPRSPASAVVGSGDMQHARDQERPAGDELEDAEALHALADHVVRRRPAR